MKYFTIWWIPIVTYIIPLTLFLVAITVKSDLLVDIVTILFMINIIGNVISAIVQILIKKWYWLFPQIIITLIIYFFFSTYLALSNPDFYGANKTIPTNIEIYEPISEEIVEIDLKENDFYTSKFFSTWNL